MSVAEDLEKSNCQLLSTELIEFARLPKEYSTSAAYPFCKLCKKKNCKPRPAKQLIYIIVLVMRWITNVMKMQLQMLEG